jgi:hypothetical protein
MELQWGRLRAEVFANLVVHKMQIYAYYALDAQCCDHRCVGLRGQELLDRLLRHPELEVVALGSDSLAGQPAAALDVRLNSRDATRPTWIL